MPLHLFITQLIIYLKLVMYFYHAKHWRNNSEQQTVFVDRFMWIPSSIDSWHWWLLSALHLFSVVYKAFFQKYCSLNLPILPHKIPIDDFYLRYNKNLKLSFLPYLNLHALRLISSTFQLSKSKMCACTCFWLKLILWIPTCQDLYVIIFPSLLTAQKLSSGRTTYSNR